MEIKAVVLARKNGDSAEVALPRTSADLVGYEKENSTATNVKEALDEINDNFQGEAPGIVQRVEALEKKKPYELCEFYYFRHPTLRPGFQPAQGGLITNAATLYPDAWAYLQTAEGQKLCKTEAEWQAMSTATWYTLADGTKVGWEGIGGVPYYVQDLNAGTLRLPDLRGMYAEASGFDSLDAGGVHGDTGRELWADIAIGPRFSASQSGATVIDGSGMAQVSVTGTGTYFAAGSTNGPTAHVMALRASFIAPTAAKNQPRAWGALACCYLGQRAS